ncbi:fatty acyl-AMP ligase [Streptomyces sp. NBC_00485]|uniref:fatty acyl-AMP ligase n=1 Tax=unclassified Streptomyces TaxID=2593676 RepID=UPI002E18738A
MTTATTLPTTSATPSDPAAETTLDRFLHHAERQPTAPAFTFLDDDGEVQRTLSYGELDATARSIAAGLRSRLARGERALLLLPEGLDFVPAFFGCLQAGVIAVPAYPPLPLQNRQRMETLKSIVDDCRPAAVIVAVPPEMLDTVRSVMPDLADLWWTTVAELSAADAADAPDDHRPGPDDIAFLQYTSGSTAMPKGVTVTHRALAHNEEMIRESFEHDQGLTGVGWLPLFHDMGLIGHVVQPLWMGGHSILMSPLTFIRRPVRWLRAISQYRATTSGAPNFAYDMCVARIREEDCEGLDLSSWKVAYTGAEPVRDRTLRAFAERFAAHGFDSTAAYPCYGLAEATLLVTGARVAAEPVRLTVDDETLGAGRVLPADVGTTLVSSGTTRMDREVVIVDPDTAEPVGPGRVGEIWIGGPDLPTGYWGRPEVSDEVFAAKPVGGGGPYLRSGDLGFLHDGELYVTGRCKDLIIVGGRNHYPQDLEFTAEQAHSALRTGCSAAFAVEDGGAERAVLVAGAGQGAAGTDEAAAAKRAEIARVVRTAVAAAHGITLDDVVVVGPNAVPRTSSGKVQRGACRAAYLRGEYAQ